MARKFMFSWQTHVVNRPSAHPAMPYDENEGRKCSRFDIRQPAVDGQHRRFGFE
jgi:hypothetical protein